MFYYEQMFNTALSGIMSAGLMSTILTVAYGILLASLLFSAYEAWTKGGDVRALGVAGVKYLALGALFMNDGAVYERVFRDVLGSVQSDLSHHGGCRANRRVQRLGQRYLRPGQSIDNLPKSCDRKHSWTAQRASTLDRDDRVSGGLRVVRSLLLALRHHPVRDRPACAGSNAELWIGFVGQAIRNQRHDLCLVGFDLWHLLPLGDCDQREQHGGAHIGQ